MNILVTGATGFIGRRVAQRLVAQGHTVRCLVRATTDLRPLQYLPVEIWRGDMLDPESLRGAVEDVQAIVHLVGILREHPPESTFRRIHVDGTRQLLDAAKGAGIRRFFYMSSIGAGSDPRYQYFLSKWLAEEQVQSSGIPWTVIRAGVVFGEGDEFLNRLADLVRHPPSGGRTLAPIVPIIGSGQTRFQPVWVEDVADCIARAATQPEYENRLVTIGGPDHFTYEQLIDMVMDATGVHRPKVHVPVMLMRPAVAMMPLVYKEPPITPEQLRMLEVDGITDIDAVQQQFGFTPARLVDTLEYLRS